MNLSGTEHQSRERSWDGDCSKEILWQAQVGLLFDLFATPKSLNQGLPVKFERSVFKCIFLSRYVADKKHEAVSLSVQTESSVLLRALFL